MCKTITDRFEANVKPILKELLVYPFIKPWNSGSTHSGRKTVRFINSLDIKHLCEGSSASLCACQCPGQVCLSVPALVWGCVKCIIVFVRLFACVFHGVCVDRIRSRHAAPKFRDTGLISCGSGSRLQFLQRFPAGCSSSLLMGLPRVDASRGGCQKVKVPYSFGSLQSSWRFGMYSDPSVKWKREAEGTYWREKRRRKKNFLNNL